MGHIFFLEQNFKNVKTDTYITICAIRRCDQYLLTLRACKFVF
jgi:hypothetical protein